MRAVTVPEYGATPSVTEVPTPEPGPGEILVKLIAAGMNPIDGRIADGFLKNVVEARFPLVLGSDGAGVVETTGEGVTRFHVGDQVFGTFAHVDRGLGGYAEYAVVAEDGVVARMPDGMIYSQAAAVPTASMTAFNVVEDARVDFGKVVLVVGATGGVGQAVVQLAHDRGARVIATARPDMVEEMKRLGADETVDHRDGDLNEQVLALHDGGVDAVVDMVSDQAAVERLSGLLKPGGTYLSTIDAVNPDAMDARELRGVDFENRPSGELLGELADLIDAGKLQVRITREVSLADAPAALAELMHGGARGKTVVRL